IVAIHLLDQACSERFTRFIGRTDDHDETSMMPGTNKIAARGMCNNDVGRLNIFAASEALLFKLVIESLRMPRPFGKAWNNKDCHTLRVILTGQWSEPIISAWILAS